MHKTKTISIFVITHQKIVFPKSDFLKFLYIPLKNKKDILHVLKTKQKDNGWIIVDTLDYIQIATKFHFKTILFANASEKKWHTNLHSYATYIAVSPIEVATFFSLLYAEDNFVS